MSDTLNAKVIKLVARNTESCALNTKNNDNFNIF